jgi:hypothetical protein
MRESSSKQTEHKCLGDATQKFSPVHPNQLDQSQGTDLCSKVFDQGTELDRGFANEVSATDTSTHAQNLVNTDDKADLYNSTTQQI